MLFRVTGIYQGKTKKGDYFYSLHVVELERSYSGMRGVPVGNYYCTKEVADSVVPDKVYNLSTSFGSKNVVSAELVEDK